MKVLFVFQLLLGLVLIVVGIAATAVPHALLDVVLSPSELKDDAKRDAMLMLLQKGAGFGPAALMVGGCAVCFTAVVGLALAQKRRRPPV
jgi:hypothetical protein